MLSVQYDGDKDKGEKTKEPDRYENALQNISHVDKINSYLSYLSIKRKHYVAHSFSNIADKITGSKFRVPVKFPVKLRKSSMTLAFLHICYREMDTEQLFLISPDPQ